MPHNTKYRILKRLTRSSWVINMKFMRLERALRPESKSLISRNYLRSPAFAILLRFSSLLHPPPAPSPRPPKRQFLWDEKSILVFDIPTALCAVPHTVQQSNFYAPSSAVINCRSMTFNKEKHENCWLFKADSLIPPLPSPPFDHKCENLLDLGCRISLLLILPPLWQS